MCWWFAMQSIHKNPGAINEDTYRVWWEAGLGLAFEKLENEVAGVQSKAAVRRPQQLSKLLLIYPLILTGSGSPKARGSCDQDA